MVREVETRAASKAAPAKNSAGGAVPVPTFANGPASASMREPTWCMYAADPDVVTMSGGVQISGCGLSVLLADRVMANRTEW